LAEKESLEGEIIEAYLPEQLTADEIGKIVDRVVGEVGAASGRDFGKVMKPVMAEIAGRADGKAVKEIVDKALSGL